MKSENFLRRLKVTLKAEYFSDNPASERKNQWTDSQLKPDCKQPDEYINDEEQNHGIVRTGLPYEIHKLRYSRSSQRRLAMIIAGILAIILICKILLF